MFIFKNNTIQHLDAGLRDRGCVFHSHQGARLPPAPSSLRPRIFPWILWHLSRMRKSIKGPVEDFEILHLEMAYVSLFMFRCLELHTWPHVTTIGLRNEVLLCAHEEEGGM